MPGWFLYLAFVIVLAAMACVVLVLKVHQYFPRKRRVLCPETRSPAAIKLRTGHAVKTFFTNIEELRVRDCERWPARAECDQECLLQVDLEPAMLDRTLARFYEGKSCARCNALLREDDWKRGHFAMLNEKDKFVPAARMPLNRFPMALEGWRPLCRACHQAEVRRQTPPEPAHAVSYDDSL